MYLSDLKAIEFMIKISYSQRLFIAFNRLMALLLQYA
jgi:hypothetical protein